MTVGGGIARPYSVNGTEGIGTASHRGSGNFANIVCIGGQLGDNRNIYSGLNRSGNLFNQLRILAHGHTVTLGVGAGEIELQTIGHRRHNFGHLDKLLDTAAKDRN